jgi:hypothetical protein
MAWRGRSRRSGCGAASAWRGRARSEAWRSRLGSVRRGLAGRSWSGRVRHGLDGYGKAVRVW